MVHNPATGRSVRLEIPNAPEIGGDEILQGHWVVVEGQMVGVGQTCLDGVNTENRPTFIYRWHGVLMHWEVFNPGCDCWVAWQ